MYMVYAVPQGIVVWPHPSYYFLLEDKDKIPKRGLLFFKLLLYEPD
jgi:hypothetical protein